MNYLESVKRLKREAGRSAGGIITSLTDLSEDDQMLAEAVAEAWLELQRRPHGWSWMRRELAGVTVADQASYTAAELDATAGDFGRWLPPATEGYNVLVRRLTEPTGPWALRFMPWEKFRVSFVLSAAAPGQATFYSISPDDRLWLGPTSTEALSLFAAYYTAPQQLLAETDEPNIPAEYHMINVWRALMEVASFDAAPEVFTRAASNFANIDTDLRARYGPQMGFAPVTLR